MTEVIGVRFKRVGKVYYFNPDKLNIPTGAHVIVETARGVEMGEVVLANHMVEDGAVVQPLKKVIRVATDKDMATVERHKKKEKETFAVCEKAIAEHGLDMKLVDVEYTFDGNKILFYFTADGRVDFRELVKDLASRVQNAHRAAADRRARRGQDARAAWAYAARNCAAPSFWVSLQPVSIKMAKEQGLSLNPAKISGTCGRLMCCLKFEQAAYESLTKITPGVGALVQTPEYRGVVTEVNLLRGIVKVRKENDSEAQPKAFQRKDVKILKNASEYAPSYANDLDKD